MRRVERKVVMNLLIAIAISLVVNFSYLMISYAELQPLEQYNEQANALTPGEGNYEGRYEASRWGHGYIVTKYRDTVYVPYLRARRILVNEGDTLRVVASSMRSDTLSTPVMNRVLRRNGVNIVGESSPMKNRYKETKCQLLYFLLLSMVIISITTMRFRGQIGRLRCTVAAIVAAVALYPLCPVVQGRAGNLTTLLLSLDLFAYVAILKWAFALISSMLYSWVYILLTRQQRMSLENERLANENITTRYNMLMSQINPHFFFNSLNSLSMLVREGDQRRGLKYIDQLSYTFRYNIQNGEGQMTTLSEEMRFAEAYTYLFKIRYAEKLFFDIDIDEQYESWLLPAMSLQPLLDNAVKHNTITTLKPLHISIRTEGEWLIVENPKRPKIEREPSTGIGIDNLIKRWALINGGGVQVEQSDEIFRVKMKLTKPKDK